MVVDLTLHVLTDRKLSLGRSHVEVARAAIAGGARLIQFREKEMSTRDLVETAQQLRALTRQAGVALIVNDRLDVALAVDADGVHVGQDDMPVLLARKLMGAGKIVGVSAGNLDEALRGVADGADYLGVGPVFATGSKADAGAPLGLAGLAEIKRHVSIPVVAIGGITAANVSDVLAAGADGIAVISAVVSQEDIAGATRELLNVMRQTLSVKRQASNVRRDV